jgi:2-dehydro-3-deoxygluconokinase
MEAAGKSMKQIHLIYPKVRAIAYTFRLEETYFGILQHGHERVISKKFQLKDIVDKVGSGDAFMAGFIYGMYKRQPPQDIIDFAAAAAFNKLFIKGDATTSTVEKIREGYLQYG